jgi:Protein of unknown function (DUF1266)
MHLSNRCTDAKMRVSKLSTHPSPTTLGDVLAGGLLSVALAMSNVTCYGTEPQQRSSEAAKHATDTAQAPAPMHPDPASACLAGGGKYLGDMRCQMADGSFAQILSGADAIRASNSATPVAPRSPHAWALATTAITFEFNGDRHDLLTGTVATPDGREGGKRLLSKWWGVDNHDELVEMLNWLQFEGHRVNFAELGRRVGAMNEQQFETTKAALLLDEQDLHRLEVVRQNYRLLGNKGILAWDLVRYIALCRWGYLAGYLSETEAWDRIMPAARRLQQTFSSWRDLQDDFLIGREFWSVQQTRENGGRFRSIYAHFLQDPSSPWNVNPWKMDLGVATPIMAH